jgi:succinoglycan biosynthesis transport protein ExoP
MELSAYLYPIRKWWWLLVSATLLAAISSFIVTRRQPPIYQARTTLIIGRAIEDPNPTSGEFYLAGQLAATYADIANREPIRNATMEALKLNWLPVYYARALPNSQMIEISVTDIDPVRAQVVTNELANQLILQSPTGSIQDQARMDFINSQLDSLQEQIQETTDEITKLQDQLGGLNSARQIADTQNQINVLQTKLNTLQANYAGLLANTQSGASNTLSVLEPAQVPSTPIGPNKMITIVLSAFIGLIISAGAAYGIEFLDHTVKTGEDIKRILNVPVIGVITRIEDEEQVYSYVSRQPRSPIADAFRSLRTNLEFSDVDQPLRTLLVSSSDASDGKTTIAVNLAIAMAHADKKVVLVDADLRRPMIHEVLDISAHFAMSDLLRGRLNVFDAIHYWGDDYQIGVITAGAPPPNPAELLGSRKMTQVISDLREVADIVIIDGPPFIFADTSLLASKVDGILLVIQPGRTSQEKVRAMKDQIDRSGTKIIGVALNNVSIRDARSYGGYYYSSYYYYSNQEQNVKPDRSERKGKGNILKRNARIPKEGKQKSRMPSGST